MAKDNSFLQGIEKKDKRVFLALSIAIFGIMLFVAFALTVPWGK